MGHLDYSISLGSRWCWSWLEKSHHSPSLPCQVQERHKQWHSPSWRSHHHGPVVAWRPGLPCALWRGAAKSFVRPSPPLRIGPLETGLQKWHWDLRANRRKSHFPEFLSFHGNNFYAVLSPFFPFSYLLIVLRWCSRIAVSNERRRCAHTEWSTMHTMHRLSTAEYQPWFS